MEWNRSREVVQRQRHAYGDGTVSTEWAHGKCEYCRQVGPTREVLDGTVPSDRGWLERHPIACKRCIPCSVAEAVAERAWWHAYKHTYSPRFREGYGSSS